MYDKKNFNMRYGMIVNMCNKSNLKELQNKILMKVDSV